MDDLSLSLSLLLSKKSTLMVPGIDLVPSTHLLTDRQLYYISSCTILSLFSEINNAVAIAVMHPVFVQV
jgi:hypothetical protein